MSRLSRVSASLLRRYVLGTAVYEGSEGTAWFAGLEPRTASIAAFFCGDDVRPGGRGRVWRHRIGSQISDIAEAGGLPIVRLQEPDPKLASILERSITVPLMVGIHTELPADVDSLRSQLLTSTTREDFRRIRRANFTYRVTSDADAIREFHARHYSPLVAQQFPEDGRVGSVENMLDELGRGGELVCADIDGVWVAGMFNIRHGDRYAMMSLGIRDADNAVRQKRVVAALIIRSLERAVELGVDRATLGKSLPFLGKGPVWFKAKWSGKLSCDSATPEVEMFLDLRHAAVRRMLAASPVIHAEGGSLVVSAWLEPGDDPLKVTTREAGRFPGITRWYVLGEPETLAAGAEALATRERIVPVPVTPHADHPLWLGETLPSPAT
jgi:hypothetical protein